MKDKDSRSSCEFDWQIVEFEEWRRKNNSTDLQAYAKDRQLTPEAIEELKRCLQMEEKLSRLIDGDDFASEQQKVRDSSKQTIGNYQLQEKLGVGGMGAVWLAYQSHPMKRKVAIKLIRPDRDSAVTVRRFEREKQALALMSHTHVAQVYHAGTSEDNRPYIAMEYIDGEPITDYCQKRQLPLAGRLELFLQLCSAIQHAHQNGLLHRDIKPSNILVTDVDGEPNVKVIDFGLVRPSDPWDPQITETDMVVGTPLWMSPEQAGGFRDVSKNEKVKTVDTRTDVYSLGVILYQLLTDSTPISEEYYERATKLELLQTIQNDVPELPSVRVGKSGFTEGKNSTPVSSWASVLRNELDWVTMRALEKECERRYPTVATLAEDVNNYLSNEPVTARPPSFSYRLRKLAQRHKTVAIASSIILSLLVLSSFAFARIAYQADRNAKAAQVAEAEAKESEMNAKQAEAVAKESEAVAQKAVKQRSKAMQLMAKVIGDNYNPSANGARFKESQVKILDEFRTEVDENDFSDDPLLETAFRQILADTYSGSAEYDSAIEQYERVIDILSKTPDSNARLLIEAKLSLAHEHSLHMADMSVLPLAKECLEESRERFGENDELTIVARTLFNKSSLPSGDNDKITADLRKTVALSKDVLGDSRPETINAMNALCIAYQRSRNHVEEAEQIETTLELAKERYGINDRRTLDLRIRQLTVKGHLGRSKDFGDELEKLLEEWKEKFGADHLFTIRSRLKKSHRAITSGDFESAEKQLVELVKDCTEHFGESHDVTLNSRIDLGRMYFHKAVYARGAERKILLSKSNKIFTVLLEGFKASNLSESVFAIKTSTDLARVLMKQGSAEDLEEAMSVIGRVLPMAKEKLGFDSMTTVLLLESRCKILFQMGRADEALASGIEAYRNSLGPNGEPPSITTVTMVVFVADAYSILGRREKAREYYELALAPSNELHGKSGLTTLIVLAALCNVQACLRDFESAEITARKLIDQLPKQIPQRARMVQKAEVTIGESLCERGMFKEGRALLEKSLDSPFETSDLLFELRAKSALALCYEAEGKRSDAINTLKSAKAGMDKLTGMHPRYNWIIERCVERLAKLEKSGEAKDVKE